MQDEPDEEDGTQSKIKTAHVGLTPIAGASAKRRRVEVATDDDAEVIHAALKQQAKPPATYVRAVVLCIEPHVTTMCRGRCVIFVRQVPRTESRLALYLTWCFVFELHIFPHRSSIATHMFHMA